MLALGVAAECAAAGVVGASRVGGTVPRAVGNLRGRTAVRPYENGRANPGWQPQTRLGLAPGDSSADVNYARARHYAIAGGRATSGTARKLSQNSVYMDAGKRVN